MENVKQKSLLLSALCCDNRNKDAIVFKKRHVSYHELEGTVARLITYLRARGVRKGDRVAVWLKKSPESVLLLLATLGAGAAYVPIDPGAPDARVKLLLEDSQPVLLFSGEDNQNRPVLENGNITALDVVLLSGTGTGYDLSPLIDGHALGSLTESAESDLAAILYTSGSTGTPKGVMLSHGNISNFVNWAVQSFSLKEDDRITSHAPFHFDLSTFDLFATFHAGGTVYLLDEVSIKFPGAIAKLLEDEQITVWYSVPTALRMLAEHGGVQDRDLKDLRLILFAGEVFHPNALRSVMTTFTGSKFINLYGPTETNVCTYFEVPRPLPPDISSIPIGIPCEPLNVRIYDDNGQLLTDGETGEICVFGPGVMLGYWNDAQKTECSRVNGRSDSYRTGDYGFVRPDGNLMFTGRRDSQVKFRGHRVELQEIEAVASTHADIKEAVAIVVLTENEEQLLRVFAVTHVVGQMLDPDDIKQHVAKKLPVYCVPDEVFVVEDLPRTSTGKIDRNTLKAGNSNP